MPDQEYPRRDMRCDSVDYAALAGAKLAAEALFPDAREVKALVNNGAPYVEVWANDGTARTWTPTTAQIMAANVRASLAGRR